MEAMKKERRLGTFTFGVMLIVVGISVVIMTFTGIEFLKYALVLWPVALIFLGGEILFFSFKQDRFKIDFGSIVLMCVTLFLTAVFSVGNYAVNKVLYDDDVRTMLVNDFVAEPRNYYVEGAVTVKTDGDERVRTRFVQTARFATDETAAEQTRIELKVSYDAAGASIAQMLDFQNKLYYDNMNLNTQEVLLYDLPDFVDDVYITVYGTDESCMKTELL